MGKRLFVGNLAYTLTEESLADLFKQSGTVESVKIITDKMSGRSKGFGFVEMTTDQEAESAIQEMNGKEIDGRAITVNEARPMEDRNGGGFGGGRSQGGGGGFRGGRNNDNRRSGGYGDRPNY